MAINLRGVGQGLRAVGQGLLLGGADELEAALRAIGPGTYEDELEKIRRSYGEWAEENPGAQLTGELIGGAVPMVAGMLSPWSAPVAVAAGARNVGALKRITDAIKAAGGAGKTVGQRTMGENVARMSMLGGAQGAATGALSAEGTGPERLIGGLMGGALGATLGAGSIVAPRLIGATYDLVRQRAMPPEDLIERTAARRLQSAYGATEDPRGIAEAVEADQALGVPTLPLNVNQGTTSAAELLAQRPGPSQPIIGGALRQQREGQRERIAGQISEGLARPRYYEARAQLEDTLRSGARDAYQQAYEYGAVDDPIIMDLLQQPEFKAAFQRAQAISRMEQQAAKLRGEDPSAYTLQSVYRSTGSFDPEAVLALRQMGIPEDRISMYLAGAPGAMEMAEVTIPDVRTLDYIKRGLDAVIDQGFRGQGMSTAEAKALRDLRNLYVQRLDELVPEYKAARQQYAGDLEVRDALDMGFERFGAMDLEEVSSFFSSASKAEKDAFRVGAARSLYGAVMDPSQNADYAQRIIGSPSTRKKLRAIFPSDEAYNLFEAALNRESQLFKNASQILGGSATFRRQAAEEAFAGDPIVEAAMVMTQQGFEGGLVNMILNAISRGKITDSVAERMATMLTAGTPEEVGAVVEALEKMTAYTAPRARNRAGVSAGVTGATLGALPPAPEGEQE